MEITEKVPIVRKSTSLLLTIILCFLVTTVSGQHKLLAKDTTDFEERLYSVLWPNFREVMFRKYMSIYREKNGYVESTFILFKIDKRKEMVLLKFSPNLRNEFRKGMEIALAKSLNDLLSVGKHVQPGTYIIPLNIYISHYKPISKPSYVADFSTIFGKDYNVNCIMLPPNKISYVE